MSQLTTLERLGQEISWVMINEFMIVISDRWFWSKHFLREIFVMSQLTALEKLGQHDHNQTHLVLIGSSSLGSICVKQTISRRNEG